MQATKQQPSPGVKKSPSNGKSDCSPTTPTKSSSAIKSVAQRVMEVAVISKNSSSTLAKQTLGASNKDLEDITSRVAKLDAKETKQPAFPGSPSKQQAPPSGDQNNNVGCPAANTNIKTPQSGSSSSLSHLFEIPSQSDCPPVPSTSNIFNQIQPALASVQTNSLLSSESVFRQIVTMNGGLKPSSTSNPKTTSNEEVAQAIDCKDKVSASNKKTSFKETCITLNTKVPHPLEGKHEEKEEEEVSYYNDQASVGNLANGSTPETRTDSDRQQQANQNGKVTGQQKSSGKSITSGKRSAEHHKLSIVVPKSCEQRNHLQLKLTENDDYDDESESRYDRVELASAALEQERPEHRQASTSNLISIPSSPKATSAPATPCNVRPTAFHQHTSHLNAMLNPSPANTLPPDIRKISEMNERQSATCRVLHSSIAAAGAKSSPQNIAVSYPYLDELFKRGELALEEKDYTAAVRYFDQCIKLATCDDERCKEFPYLKQNFQVYCQRAEALFYLGKYNEAIEDSMAARGLNKLCTQAYYRQGRAQFCIGQYADCLAVLSYGLKQEPTNEHLFEALVDAALKSDQFLTDFELKYNKLKLLELHKKPFYVVSVLGQELLTKGYVEHATIMLESALKMENKHGNTNKKLKGSVLSTLSYVYFLMKDYGRAIDYMKKELDVENELDHVVGQCRVLINMGHTYYKMRYYDESIDSHRKHNSLAMRTRLYHQLSIGLNAIGHVHVARNDFTCALTSHTHCLEILKQLGDNEFAQFRELLSIGHIQTMSNDFNAAGERYNEAIQLLKSSSRISQELKQEGYVMVYFNLAYLSLKKQSYSGAKHYYEQVNNWAKLVAIPKRHLFEMKAAYGLGQAHRLFKNLSEAEICFKNQFRLAETLQDRKSQSQALCNLAMIAQHAKEYNTAWKLLDENLSLVEKDPLLKAYAHSYMGSIYLATNKYEESQEHYRTSLEIFKNLKYCSTETKIINTNLSTAVKRMGVNRN